MTGNHWSDDDLLNRVYGMGPEDSHLGECAECGARWLQLVERRKTVIESPPVSAAFLAEQRGKIHSRIGKPEELFAGLRPAPILAAIAVTIIAALLSVPRPESQATMASNDAQFFSEVYSLVESPEPLAAAPIRELFEE